MELSGLDQLWVADITYVRMREEFAYLAIVLDAFSRRVVGWALETHMLASLAMAALKMALEARRPQPGSLVHHSDRGVQYACGDYTDILDAHGIAASMSRVGNPYDNAKAESFMKTLKQEEVDGSALSRCRTRASAIGAFLEDVYNRQRLHSALDYRSPVEFEAQIPRQDSRHRAGRQEGFQGMRKSTAMNEELRDAHHEQGRHASARRPRSIAVSFLRLFLGGLLPSRARFRFAGATHINPFPSRRNPAAVNLSPNYRVSHKGCSPLSMLLILVRNSCRPCGNTVCNGAGLSTSCSCSF